MFSTTRTQSVRAVDEGFDLVDGTILAELDGARLRVAPRGADLDAGPVDGERRLVLEDLVPFLAAPAAVEGAVDPGEEARREGRPEPVPRKGVVHQGVPHAPIDREGHAHRFADCRHLRRELAHVGCPCPGRGLIGHARHLAAEECSCSSSEVQVVDFPGSRPQDVHETSFVSFVKALHGPKKIVGCPEANGGPGV